MVPRSLVQHLEQQIASLEAGFGYKSGFDNLSQLGSQRSSDLSRESRHDHLQSPFAWQIHDRVAGWAVIAGQDLCDRTILGLRGSCFHPLIMKSSILPLDIETDCSEADPTARTSVASEGRDIASLDAIPTHVAEALIKVYIEKILPQYPFFAAEELYLYQSLAYQEGTVSIDVPPRAEFIVAMMMAISTLTSKNQHHEQLTSLSTSLYKYAMQRYDALLEPSLLNLQCTMLLCQFANFCPSVAEIWTLKEMAIRMAIAIGLHKEPSHSLSCFSNDHLELRRKIFWTLYSMDRSISIASKRPVSIDDESIDINWPYEDCGFVTSPVTSGTRMQNLRFLRHVRFRQIQSEIYAVNFTDKTPLKLPYSEWMDAKDQQLLEWRRSLDSLTETGFEWFDFVMFTGQMYLHMHCPRNPHPASRSVISGFEAAKGTADGYFGLYCKGFLKYDWHCAHHVLAAGILLIRLVKHDYQILLHAYSSRQINATIEKCFDVLTLLCKKWPDASRCLEKLSRCRSDLFHAFSLATDIFMSAGGGLSTGDDQLEELAFTEIPPVALVATPQMVIQQNNEDLTNLGQNFDPWEPEPWESEPWESEPWEYTINVFKDFTESDWDAWAGQTEMHWPI